MTCKTAEILQFQFFLYQFFSPCGDNDELSPWGILLSTGTFSFLVFLFFFFFFFCTFNKAHEFFLTI